MSDEGPNSKVDAGAKSPNPQSEPEKGEKAYVPLATGSGRKKPSRPYAADLKWQRKQAKK